MGDSMESSATGKSVPQLHPDVQTQGFKIAALRYSGFRISIQGLQVLCQIVVDMKRLPIIMQHLAKKARAAGFRLKRGVETAGAQSCRNCFDNYRLKRQLCIILMWWTCRCAPFAGRMPHAGNRVSMLCRAAEGYRRQFWHVSGCYRRMKAWCRSAGVLTIEKKCGGLK